MSTPFTLRMTETRLTLVFIISNSKQARILLHLSSEIQINRKMLRRRNLNKAYQTKSRRLKALLRKSQLKFSRLQLKRTSWKIRCQTLAS